MADVYDAIVQACQAFHLPPPWQDIPCAPAFRRLPGNLPALLRELQRLFSDDRLVEAGVAGLATEPSLEINSQFAGNEPICAICLRPDQKVTALIAKMDDLCPKRWAFASALLDHQQNELIAAADNQIVVAYSMQDLAILRSIGIAAVPGGSWSCLSRQKLEFLRQHMQARSLIIANWSLAMLDRTEINAATTSWSHLVDLQRNLDLGLDCSRWTPNQRFLEKLGFYLRYETVPNLRNILLDSLGNDAIPIDADLLARRSPPQSIGDAHRAWQRAQREADQFATKKAYQRLCELVDQRCFEPLVHEAMLASDPLARNAELALAEASRLLQTQMPLLTEKIRKSIGENGTTGGSPYTKEEFSQILGLTNQVIALTKGVVSCRQQQKPKTINSNQPWAQGCRPSASPRKISPH